MGGGNGRLGEGRESSTGEWWRWHVALGKNIREMWKTP